MSSRRAPTFDDLLDAVAHRGWHTKETRDGVLVFPAGTHECIAIKTRANETDLENARARLRRSGLILTDESKHHRKEKPAVAAVSRPEPAAPAVVDPFDKISAKISAAVNLLSEIEQDLAAIRTDQGKLAQLRELLKGGI